MPFEFSRVYRSTEVPSLVEPKGALLTFTVLQFDRMMVKRPAPMSLASLIEVSMLNCLTEIRNFCKFENNKFTKKGNNCLLLVERRPRYRGFETSNHTRRLHYENLKPVISGLLNS